MPNESKLPAAQQARRAELEAAAASDNNATDNVTPIGTVQRPTTVAPPTVTTPSVTSLSDDAANPPVITGKITAKELQSLRDKAEKADQAARRSSMLELELVEAQARLTQLEASAKASATDAPAAAPAPSSLHIDPGATDLDPEEEATYGSSQDYINKLTKKQIADLVNPQLTALDARLRALEGSAGNQASQAFRDKVKNAIGADKFEAILVHPKWVKFIDKPMPGAGMKYAEAIGVAHHNAKLDDMTEIFGRFEKQYMHDEGTDEGTGYEGISVVGSSGAQPVTPSTNKKLKMSDRRQASDDFVKGRITQAELNAIKAEFEKANKEDRIEND